MEMNFKSIEDAMSVARILVKPITPIPKTVPKITPPPLQRRREIVAGGDIRWKPVDRAAAMLLTQAQDINKPRHESKPIHNPHHDAQTVESAQSSSIQKTKVGHKRAMEPGKIQTCGKIRSDRKRKTERRVNYEQQPMKDNELDRLERSGHAKVGFSEDSAKNFNRVLAGVEEAKESLQKQLSALDDLLADVAVRQKLAIEQMRGLRMGFVAEVAQMTGNLKELRVFFHGSDHEKEIARLREFADVCERLKALKDSGFLDSVADTMLRLSLSENALQ